jgi:hypothetical protein
MNEVSLSSAQDSRTAGDHLGKIARDMPRQTATMRDAGTQNSGFKRSNS